LLEAGLTRGPFRAFHASRPQSGAIRLKTTRAVDSCRSGVRRHALVSTPRSKAGSSAPARYSCSIAGGRNCSNLLDRSHAPRATATVDELATTAGNPVHVHFRRQDNARATRRVPIFERQWTAIALYSTSSSPSRGLYCRFASGFRYARNAPETSIYEPFSPGAQIGPLIRSPARAESGATD
jgi:hypothetical protein